MQSSPPKARFPYPTNSSSPRLPPVMPNPPTLGSPVSTTAEHARTMAQQASLELEREERFKDTANYTNLPPNSTREVESSTREVESSSSEGGGRSRRRAPTAPMEDRTDSEASSRGSQAASHGASGSFNSTTTSTLRAERARGLKVTGTAYNRAAEARPSLARETSHATPRRFGSRNSSPHGSDRTGDTIRVSQDQGQSRAHSRPYRSRRATSRPYAD